ncbi:MAG: HalOD1 output domain-containing protein [Halorientalis sp.]
MGPDRETPEPEEISLSDDVFVPDGGRSGNDVSRSTWDCTDPETIPSAVVRAVAAVTDVDPLELSHPLNDVLDADALTSLLASTPGDGDISVTFEFEERLVTIRDDGHITVE